MISRIKLRNIVFMSVKLEEKVEKVELAQNTKIKNSYHKQQYWNIDALIVSFIW